MQKILVLEDDLSSLMLMTEILEKYSYKVIPATDGLEALSIAQKERPDLAIVDIMLPTLNGYEVCERLHQIPELKTLPIIILTALNEDQHRIRAIEAGAIDFLNKPFKRVEILTKIKAILAMQEENSERVPFDAVCFSFLQALALREPKLHTSSLRCAYFGKRLGVAMGLSIPDLQELYYGLLLRDIGYLAMSTDIIDTESEDDRHPALGVKIVEKFFKPALNTIILYHHCTLRSPNYPKELPDNLAVLLRIAIVCTRFDYLLDCDASTTSRKNKRDILIEEKEHGLLPPKELELLLQLTEDM